MRTMTDKIKIEPCLWFNKNAEEAAKFYAATFPNSRIIAVHKAPGDYPSGKAGDVLTVEFTVLISPGSRRRGADDARLIGLRCVCSPLRVACVRPAPARTGGRRPAG